MTEGASDEEHLGRWVEQELGGRVVSITRLPRWRPAWDLDVETASGRLELHARGERENTIIMPFRIADEFKVHELLEAHDVIVPHAYGMCPSPYALVMDRLPGHVSKPAGSGIGRGTRLPEYSAPKRFACLRGRLMASQLR